MGVYIYQWVPLEKRSLRVIFLIFFEADSTLDSILPLLTFLTVVSGVGASFSHSLGSQESIHDDISMKKVQSLPVRLQTLSSHLQSATLLILYTPGWILLGQFKKNSSFSFVNLILQWSDWSTHSRTLRIMSKSEDDTFWGVFLPSLKRMGTLFLLKQVLEKPLRTLIELRIFPSQSSRPTFLSMGLQLEVSGLPLKILKYESSFLQTFLACSLSWQSSNLKLLRQMMSPILRLRVRSSFCPLQIQTCRGSLWLVWSMILIFWVKSLFFSQRQAPDASTMSPVVEWSLSGWLVCLSFSCSFLAC